MAVKLKLFVIKEKKMANKRFWLGMLVLVLVFGMTVVGLTSCDDDLWSQEGSFTMGNESSTGGGDYEYIFYNCSFQYDVKITIDDVTHTIKRPTPGSAYGTMFKIINSSKTITVTYSPRHSVYYSISGLSDYTVEFRDK